MTTQLARTTPARALATGRGKGTWVGKRDITDIDRFRAEGVSGTCT